MKQPPSANALLSIQVIPSPPGQDEVIPLVDQAIAVIADAGVKFRVGPLETTMEGELGQLLDIVRKVSDRMLELGCAQVISQIKIYHCASGASMDRLTEKYDAAENSAATGQPGSLSSPDKPGSR